MLLSDVRRVGGHLAVAHVAVVDAAVVHIAGVHTKVVHIAVVPRARQQPPTRRSAL